MVGYAQVDETGRVVICLPNAEPWCERVYNYEVLQEVEYLTEEEFVVEGGRLVHSPTEQQFAAFEVVKAKENLADTDYIAVKIAEGAATREEYAGIIEKRRKWRETINEYERLANGH